MTEEELWAVWEHLRESQKSIPESAAMLLHGLSGYCIEVKKISPTLASQRLFTTYARRQFAEALAALVGEEHNTVE